MNINNTTPRGTLTQSSIDSSKGVSKSQELDTGTPEAREAFTRLIDKLLPSDRISRQEFLKLPPVEQETKQVSFKTMLAAVIGTWALEESMPIQSSNHMSSAADDPERGKNLATKYMSQAGFDGYDSPSISSSVNAAKKLSYTKRGSCGPHSKRNFVLIADKLKQLYDTEPALRPYLPTVAIVTDNNAGNKLGGPKDDNHVYVVLDHESPDPIVVDSWVLFPQVHLASVGKCRADSIDETFKVDTDDRHRIPDEFKKGVSLEEGIRNLMKENPSEEEPPLLEDARYQDKGHWGDEGFGRYRGWQVLFSRQDHAPNSTYKCGNLVFDTNMMGKSGLQGRKFQAQRSKIAIDLAREVGLNVSPIENAPEFSPLPVRRRHASSSVQDELQGQSSPSAPSGPELHTDPEVSLPAAPPNSPLHAAVRLNDIDTVKTLMSQELDLMDCIDVCDLALKEGHKDAAELISRQLQSSMRNLSLNDARSVGYFKQYLKTLMKWAARHPDQSAIEELKNCLLFALSADSLSFEEKQEIIIGQHKVGQNNLSLMEFAILSSISDKMVDEIIQAIFTCPDTCLDQNSKQRLLCGMLDVVKEAMGNLDYNEAILPILDIFDQASSTYYGNNPLVNEIYGMIDEIKRQSSSYY